MVVIRSTKISDYQEINAIKAESHPDNYHEDESKMQGYPEGCFVADLDGIVGYLISFPYVLGKPYPIDKKYTLVDEPNCHYIYDLCVMPEFRKMGIAKKLAKKIIEMKWPVIGLVAVMNSVGFWHKLGFRSFSEIEYYGLKAEYMLRLK